MKKVVHFEVHFVILYSKTELLKYTKKRFYLYKLYQSSILKLSNKKDVKINVKFRKQRRKSCKQNCFCCQ